MASPIIPHPFNLMARLANYDRNALPQIFSFTASLPNHGWTLRWTYTVPANKKAFHCILADAILVAINVAGNYCDIMRQVNSIVVGVNQISRLVHFSTTDYAKAQTITAEFFLRAADYVSCYSTNTDNINHSFAGGSIFMEFDA